ncbi:Ribonuclease P protein component 3 [uncultured archaeon]|nr:Ribonuclease P protein component 3 [uncultured archaeon]
MIDIVFPNKNEQEFVEMAKKLGIQELIFVYKDRKDFCTGTNALLVEPKDVRKTHDKKTMAICAASREAIEREADIVYGFELLEIREHTHYRASGMNQVLCKLAADKKVKIGFSFSSILNSYGQKRAILMGRMAQNIMFCQKYKTPMKMASFATNPYEMRAEAELKAFFRQLGWTG